MTEQAEQMGFDSEVDVWTFWIYQAGSGKHDVVERSLDLSGSPCCGNEFRTDNADGR